MREVQVAQTVGQVVQVVLVLEKVPGLQVVQVTVIPVIAQIAQEGTKDAQRAQAFVTEFRSICGEELQTQEVPETTKVALQLVQAVTVQVLQFDEQATQVPVDR